MQLDKDLELRGLAELAKPQQLRENKRKPKKSLVCHRAWAIYTEINKEYLGMPKRDQRESKQARLNEPRGPYIESGTQAGMCHNKQG